MFKAIWITFRNYANHSGRSSRLETTSWFLFVSIAFFSGMPLISAGHPIWGAIVLNGVIWATYIPTSALIVRRCHDFDVDGAELVIPFLPLLNWAALPLLLKKGTAIANRFGDKSLVEEKRSLHWILLCIGILIWTPAMYGGVLMYLKKIDEHKMGTELGQTRSANTVRSKNLGPSDDQFTAQIQSATPLKKTRTNQEERYLALKAIERDCLDVAETRYGSVRHIDRNFCACLATKTLAAMSSEQIVNYTESGVLTLPAGRSIGKECTFQ